MYISRRHFMKRSLGALTTAGSVGVLAQLGAMNAFADCSGGYKALVCIYLNGGMDCHNAVIPYPGSALYAAYNNARGGTPLALNSTLLSNSGINSLAQPTAAPDFALAPEFSNLRRLYNLGQVAIVANVGPINVSSATLDPKYLTSINYTPYLPENAYSHSDQTNQWQAAAAVNSLIGSGWGGRLAEGCVNNSNQNGLPLSFNAGSSGLFNIGNSSSPMVANGTGSARGLDSISRLNVGLNGSSVLTGAGSGTPLTLLRFTNGTTLMQAADTLSANGDQQAQQLLSALANSRDLSAGFRTPPPDNTLATSTLAKQLALVAQLISVQVSLGINRQVFFVSMGGFDTHTGETALTAPNGLQTQLDLAIGAFFNNLGSCASSVTAFTASEFGRSLQPASGGGSDHGWGGHHFVISGPDGGLSAGGKIYGKYPDDITVGGPHDATTPSTFPTKRGVLIPTTSVEQYVSPIARWFGVDPLTPNLFPNLAMFATSGQNLDFMKSA